MTPTPHELEQGILSLLAGRDPAASICPSEVARAQGGEAWGDLMEPVRAAAWRLVAVEQVVVTQRGSSCSPAPSRTDPDPPGLCLLAVAFSQ